MVFIRPYLFMHTSIRLLPLTRGRGQQPIYLFIYFPYRDVGRKWWLGGGLSRTFWLRPQQPWPGRPDESSLTVQSVHPQSRRNATVVHWRPQFSNNSVAYMWFPAAGIGFTKFWSRKPLFFFSFSKRCLNAVHCFIFGRIFAFGCSEVILEGPATFSTKIIFWSRGIF